MASHSYIKSIGAPVLTNVGTQTGHTDIYGSSTTPRHRQKFVDLKLCQGHYH